MSRPGALVVGAGPGVSGSLALRLAATGYDVALVGLGVEVLRGLADGVSATGARALWSEADVTDEAALAGAVATLGEDLGRVERLHFNPSAYRAGSALEVSSAELLADLALGCGALLTTVQAARPWLVRGARVTATGSVAADRPDPRAATLGVQKAALRNVVHSLDRVLAPEGVRAVSVTVEGVIERRDTSSPFHPDAIAGAILAAAEQPEDRWLSEVRHPAPPRTR